MSSGSIGPELEVWGHMRNWAACATTVALLLLLGLSPVSAVEHARGTTGHSAVLQSAAGTSVEVRAGHTSSRLRPIRAAERMVAGGSTADIQVTYNADFPLAARTAFDAAVSIWESRVVSTQVIRVDATWQPMQQGVLGSAGPTFIYLLPDGYWYPAALREAICSCNQAGIEIEANFNSSFANWYLETDGNTPNGKYDFVTVVLHELGHGLGFFGSFDVNLQGKGRWGFPANGVRYPMRYDVNEWTAATNGKRLTNTSAYPNPSFALLDQMTDGSVYFGGQNVVETLGARAELYAPLGWSGGSSNSHFDEAAFPEGTENALMTPFLSNGEVIHEPGSLTLALFRDLGWQTSGAAPGDQTPPTVHPPQAGFVAPHSLGATVAVEVSWQQAEDDSGIASYDLDYRKNTGSWNPVALDTPTSTSVELSLQPGADYRFRLSATDTQGNTSGYVTTAASRLGLAQETATQITFDGAWTRVTVGGASGGYVRRSVTTSDAATYAFNGTSVALATTLGPNRGIAEIRVDGTLVNTVDLYAPTVAAARVVWTSQLDPGSHSVEVRVTGTSNASSTGSRVDVDAFLAWR